MGISRRGYTTSSNTNCPRLRSDKACGVKQANSGANNGLRNAYIIYLFINNSKLCLSKLKFVTFETFVYFSLERVSDAVLSVRFPASTVLRVMLILFVFRNFIMHSDILR